MNKVKMFFIAAALVLTTAGVFAGKAKFANQGLVLLESGTYYNVSSALNLSGTNITTSAGTTGQLQIRKGTGTAYSVFFYDGSTYTPAISDGTW